MKRWFANICLALTIPFGAPALAGPQLEPLNMGFYLPGIRDANLADVRISLQLWAEEMGKPVGIEAKAYMYDDMRSLHRDAMGSQINLVIAPSMELAENFNPDELAPEGFTGVRRDTEEGLVLIVAKSSGIRQFTDLRGKRLLRLSNDRLTDVYLEIQCQRQTGMPCSNLLSLVEEKRDVLSIHKVFFGQADAALVRLTALQTARALNPQIDERLRLLQDWKTKALSLGMMTRNSEPAYRDLLLHSAIQATKTARGRQILEIFKTDHMDQVSKNELQPFWRLQREYQDLIKTKPVRKP